MNDLPHDGVSQGEVVVRAPWLTQGYLKDPVNSETLWAGGWLHAGDIAVIDDEGYLKMTDRIKDVIKTGGEWVSSLDLAADIDLAHKHPEAAERQRHQARVDLLTPVLKGWCTELGVEIASMGVQVFGGMGYIEETGAAQYLRDARIATIYEGTTGIQAGDLVGRKLPTDNGWAMAALIGEMRAVEGQLGGSDNVDFPAIRENLAASIQGLEQATEWILQTIGQDPDAALGASVNYMMLTGYVCGGWQMARAALAARARLGSGADEDFCRAKIATARFYAEQILPKANALLIAVKSGASTALALPEEQF